MSRLVAGRETTVFILDNLSSGNEGDIPTGNVRFIRGDVRNEKLVDRLVRRSDVVFHLAEYIPGTAEFSPGHVVRYSVDHPMMEFDVGCRGTLVVLDMCRRHDKKFIFTSTAAVYGRTAHRPVPERTPPSPSSPYGASKACSEIYATLYSQLYNLRTVTLRLFNVFGPGQRKYVMHDILVKLVNDPRRLVVLGTGRERRDFVYVDDAIDALILAATNGRAHGIYNVGTSTSISIKEVVRSTLDVVDLHPRVSYTQTSWSGDVRAVVADVSRMKALGFSPKYSLVAGLRELVKWFNQEYSANFHVRD